MPTLETLKNRIDLAEELQAIVRTMKVLAAVNIRQYDRAVKSLAEYSQTIEMGLQIVLRDGVTPAPQSTTKEGGYGAVIFGSDQGMCGRFNENISVYAIEQMKNYPVDLSDWTILAVGRRVLGYLEIAGLSIKAGFSIPGTITGLTPLVQEMLIKLEGWHERHGIDHIFIFYNKPRPVESYNPHIESFWPVDPAWLQSLSKRAWPTRILPAYRMDQAVLFASLIRQNLFAGLFRSCIESLAAENAARLASMQAAEYNIEERLAQLQTQFHHQRQSAITEELLDIVAGYEALTANTRGVRNRRLN